jgi:hypothetical protein
MDADNLRNGATVAGVSIAFLGLAYALYRDLIFSTRRRPRLDLKFDGTGADQVIVPTQGGGSAAYVRLRVTNKKGKDTADDVQVQVAERREQDGSSEPTPIGLPLIWSGTYPPATDAPVHPGFERYIDLLHVDWPRPADELDVARKYTPSPRQRCSLFTRNLRASSMCSRASTRFFLRLLRAMLTRLATPSQLSGMAFGPGRRSSGRAFASSHRRRSSRRTTTSAPARLGSSPTFLGSSSSHRQLHPRES